VICDLALTIKSAPSKTIWRGKGCEGCFSCASGS